MHYFSNPKGPKFIMLVGLPCSGKSTWLENFLEEDSRDWAVLSTDDIYEAYSIEKGITYAEAYQALPAKKVNAKFRLAINDAFKNRKNIIWDQTNVYQNARRKKMSQLAKEYEAIAVVFEVERDELDRRCAGRHAETGKFVPGKVIDEMAANYIRPSKAEGFTHVHMIT